MTDPQEPVPGTFNIREAFRNKETELRARFDAIRHVTSHPTARGDQSEADWTGLMRDFLPGRYTVGPIFAVDHTGASSEQIDVAVYDTQYSPQWFGGANGMRIVPVESVYAVFESKPEINASTFKAAVQKVASVRSLTRTSQTIYYVDGKYKKPDRRDKPIIGGIVSTRCGWEDFKVKIEEHQVPRDNFGFLNIGIALEDCAFDYTPGVEVDDEDQTAAASEAALTFSDDGHQLIHFVIRLFTQLQLIGTAPAVEMDKYEAWMRRGTTSPT